MIKRELTQFTKMHGLGNDFMVLERITQQFDLSPQLIAALADRNFGVGFDQLLIVETPSHPDADFDYRIFNADGSEVEQCGNGARCFARFVVERELSFKRMLKVRTAKSIIELKILDSGLVEVDMGLPGLDPESVGYLGAYHLSEHGLCRIETDDPPDDELTEHLANHEFCLVSMGNPHAVTRVDQIQTAPVPQLGKYYVNHADLTDGANIGFMQILNDQLINVRVFERGSGETLACGSGACAAVVAGVTQGLLKQDQPIEVRLKGGTLWIRYTPGEPVIMQGSASRVYEGLIDLTQFAA